MHDKDTSPASRSEQFPEGDPMLRMPECDSLVVQAFVDCGVCASQGMGITSISWQEIQAYSQVSGVNLTTWEARMVKLMSSEYVNYKNWATENRHGRSPYKPHLTEADTMKRAERMMRII